MNSVAPGPVLTPASVENLGQPDHAAGVLANLLIKRLGTAEDVAQLALFLASDAASWITGADMAVDGGRMAWA